MVVGFYSARQTVKAAYINICPILPVILYGYFADDSLTVDNVTKVMELVLDKRIMLIWKELKVPESLVQMRAGNVSTTNEKRGVYVELYLNYHPEPSWVNIAGALYGYQDMAAAAEAKKFYHKNGR